MRKGLTFLLAVLLIFSVTVTGCGSKQTTSDTNKEQQATQPQPEAKEKVLIFGRGGDSVALDPSIVTDGESLNVTKNIFDTLLDYEDGNTNVKPALATEWTVSPDGLEYTFKLRQGVKFHDGTDFNADAVVFNFMRWLDPKNEYRFPEQSFDYFNDMFGGTLDQEGHVIAKVEAVDPYTVKFTLTRPQAPFIQNIAMSPFAIASPDAIKKYKEKFLENPVGTGPFIFVEWKRNDSITLKKNPNYWEAGKPYLDKLIFRSIPDNSARFTALQSGEIDLMDGLNPDDVKSVESNPDLQLFKRPSMNVGYLGFNVEKPPFDNPKVRVALNYAVNKEGLIQAFYNGLAIPAKNPMPPSIWGYNDKIQDYPYDLEKAKQLLAEAGYPNGFEAELWAMPVPRPYMPNGQKIAEALQADFAKIGVKVKIVTMEWATYLAETKTGKQGMYLLGWTGDNGDPDNFIYVLLDQDNIDGSNRSRFKNQEFHDLLIKAQTVTDKAERTKLYEQAQEIFHKEAPWVPLVHSTPVLAGKANVTGFNPHPTGSDKFTNVDLK